MTKTIATKKRKENKDKWGGGAGGKYENDLQKLQERTLRKDEIQKQRRKKRVQQYDMYMDHCYPEKMK